MSLLKQQSDVFAIKSSFSFSGNLAASISLTKSVEILLQEILPKELFLKALKDPSAAFKEYQKSLPFINYSKLNVADSCFSFVVLCVGEYTYGLGRYVADILCKWLIPGKQLQLPSSRSLNFQFINFPGNKFYLYENYVYISNEKDLLSVKNNIDNFKKQMRLNILSVQHARSIVSMKRLSLEEKSALIQESIASLLEEEAKELEPTAFDKMHKVIFKLSAEKNLSQIRDNLNLLMTQKPQLFDRDIFQSIHNIILSFGDSFAANKDPKYVSRIFGFHYLLKKIVKQKSTTAPNTRHVNFKIFKALSSSQDNVIIGILLSINLFNETERFEKKHFLKAIKSIINEIKYIKDSYFFDTKDEKVKSFYIEFSKPKFSLEELKSLKKNLSHEIKQRVENTINPIFMPRNEEEVFRNIVLLNKQLKYVKDIPQVIISYDKQTGTEIQFMVILLRLLKSNSTPLKKQFNYCTTFLKYTQEDSKIIGLLKKKYPKEATIFRLSLKKDHFYRKDFSLDLLKARNAVVIELSKLIGDFRDYNGGMILKQNQALNLLKQQFPSLTTKNEAFIENFFYSIKPGIMQSILDGEVLKTFLFAYVQILNQEYEKKFIINTNSIQKHIVITIKSYLPSFKKIVENAVSALKIDSLDLTSCFIKEKNDFIQGYIYKNSDFNAQINFSNKILTAMKNWIN